MMDRKCFDVFVNQLMESAGFGERLGLDGDKEETLTAIRKGWLKAHLRGCRTEAHARMLRDFYDDLGQVESSVTCMEPIEAFLSDQRTVMNAAYTVRTNRLPGVVLLAKAI